MAYVVGLTQTGIRTRCLFSGMFLHVIPYKTGQILYANITEATTGATYFFFKKAKTCFKDYYSRANWY